MNNIQRLVLITTAIILIFMLLFPPFQNLLVDKYPVNTGYSFILNPPLYNSVVGNLASKVNVALLCIQCIIILVVGGILWFAFNKTE